MPAGRQLPIEIIKAFNDCKYCDLTIICGNSTFHVHKLVVCSRSTFFDKAVSFQFGREAEDDCIRLPEDDPEMIRRMLLFLYLGNYDPTSIAALTPLRAFKLSQHTGEYDHLYHARYGMIVSGSTSSSERNANCACVGLLYNASNLQMQSVHRSSEVREHLIAESRPEDAIQVANPLAIHASMYALADKYDIEGLANRAKIKFNLCLHDHWDSEDFIEAVQIAYSSTPDTNRGLRDVIVEAFKKYFKVDVKQIPGAEEDLATIDKLSFLLMKSWSQRVTSASESSVTSSGVIIA